MANPRSLVFALYNHWSVVEWLVQRSREIPAFEAEQVLALIGKVDPSMPRDARETVLRALINTEILRVLPRDELLQLNPYVLEFVRGLTREHELGLSAVLQARVQGIRDATGRLNDAIESNDLDLLRQSAVQLTELFRQIAQQLDQDRHAILEIAEKAKGTETHVPAERRYRQVLQAYDDYIEPMAAMMDSGPSGSFYRLLEEAERRIDYCQEKLAVQGALHALRMLVRQTSFQVKELRRLGREVLKQCSDLLKHPWVGRAELAMEQMADHLREYQQDCIRLLRLESEVRGLLAELHAGGLTKFQTADDPDEEIRLMVEFGRHLPQEFEAIERKARTAVVSVTACLRQLRGSLNDFKAKMRQFNQLIGRRRLSDLSVFKIEPEDEQELVWAIEALISTAEQVDSGQSFELFDRGSVLDDESLTRAKALLIREGDARGGLAVEHLFRLSFIVGKEGQKPEAFADIDGAASNGTVLMAKLVTGLALLHQMQDKRYSVRAACYLDEALALDGPNQTSLIDTAAEFGFALIFASPAPLATVRYCVPITRHGGHNHVSRKNWQELEPRVAEAGA